MDDRQLSVGRTQRPDRREDILAVRERDAKHACLVGEDREGLGRPQQVGHLEVPRGAVPGCRDDVAPVVRDQHLTAEEACLAGKAAFQRLRDVQLGVLGDGGVEVGRRQRGDHFHVADRVREGALACVMSLDDRTHGERRHEQGDHERDQASQPRLVSPHAKMRGADQRARQSLQRPWFYRNVGRVRTRHRLPPRSRQPPGGCAASALSRPNLNPRRVICPGRPPLTNSKGTLRGDESTNGFGAPDRIRARTWQLRPGNASRYP